MDLGDAANPLKILKKVRACEAEELCKVKDDKDGWKTTILCEGSVDVDRCPVYRYLHPECEPTQDNLLFTPRVPDVEPTVHCALCIGVEAGNTLPPVPLHSRFLLIHRTTTTGPEAKKKALVLQEETKAPAVAASVPQPGISELLCCGACPVLLERDNF